MTELTDYQKLVVEGVGKGLTNAEIIARYGGSNMGAEVRKIAHLLGFQTRIQLIIHYIEEHVPGEDPVAAEAHAQISYLSRPQNVLLAEIMRIGVSSPVEDLGDILSALRSRLDKFRDEPPTTPDTRTLIQQLREIRDDSTKLSTKIAEMAQAVGLEPKVETAWFQLVRLYYLAVLFGATPIVEDTEP